MSALVGALGELNSPLGRSLEAVVKAGSIALALQSASTVPEVAQIVGTAMELLPLDPKVSSSLSGLVVVASLAAQLITAAAATPPDIATALTTSSAIAKELCAPTWVITGLEKVAVVASHPRR